LTDTKTFKYFQILGVPWLRRGKLKFRERVQVGLHGPGKKEPKLYLLILMNQLQWPLN